MARGQVHLAEAPAPQPLAKGQAVALFSQVVVHIKAGAGVKAL